MPPPMRSVFSSHVDRIGHDVQTGDLYVQWDSGKTSVYSGVPPDLAEDVSTSWSVGSALTTRIKGAFPHRYLDSSND
jgi:hypothetical protein